MRYFGIFAAAAALLSAAHAAPHLYTRQNPDFPDPSIDPFYKAPVNIAAYQPGDIIRSRLIPSSIQGPSVSQAYQLLIRTTDGQDRAVGTVTTVWLPAKPAWPPKIFSWQVPEDSDVLDCAPSWMWIQNSTSNGITSSRVAEGPILVTWGTGQGWYVVNTDFEGPDAAWLVGKMEGHAGLDGIKAVIKLFNLPWKETKAALFGYSGGAHASVWMSSLAATYAPKVNLVGAAFGGTPVDLASAFTILNNGPASILAGGALFGLANGYAGPGANIDLNATFNAILTPEGKKVAATFRSNNFCIPNEQATSVPTDYTKIFTTDIFANTNATAVLAMESLLMNVSTLQVPVPKFPRFQYHGTNDTIVPYQPEVAYVQQQCAAGANIQFLPLPGLDHGPGYFGGFLAALQFIQQAFAGITPKVTCGTYSGAPVPMYNTSAAVAILGAELSAFLTAAIVAASQGS